MADNSGAGTHDRVIAASREAEMAAYDALPAKVRALVRDARFEFDSASIARIVKLGPARIAKRLAIAERMIMAELPYG